MVEESVGQIVTLFDRPQCVACHCGRPKARQGTHDKAATEVWPQPWVVAEHRPRFLCRTSDQFGSLDDLAQPCADGIGFLAETVELVSVHQPVPRATARPAS
jgi:hypothetical protein